jgi:hypothetical protein
MHQPAKGRGQRYKYQVQNTVMQFEKVARYEAELLTKYAVGYAIAIPDSVVVLIYSNR